MSLVLISERLAEGMELFAHTFRLPPIPPFISERVTTLDPFAQALKSNATVHASLQTLLKDDILFYEHGLRKYLSDLREMKALRDGEIVSEHNVPFFT
jgi:hypothetical protein